MEDFQESLSSSSSLSLSSTSSSPILHPSSPSSSLSFTSSSNFSSNPHPLAIDSELWLMAEQRTQEILCIIQPSFVSEERRKSIIGFFQRLIKGYYGIEVFPFGSVPLKTFLPDGDIDLTAISNQNVEEALGRDICCILETKQDSEFLVQDVQYIRAQVKLVKCTVNNISVDISFSQRAGLSALCFLEQVDQLVGKDHLFKRSIILIKAWCYYESRILGAHHGLISTYALETLILHIINIFHSSLWCPLAVLYKFLDYYSTFDWEIYCITIYGPVSISTLSAGLAGTPENDGEELLLSREFLRHCREKLSVPMQSPESGAHGFPVKHFNIVDPLKENNNLGRSVSKGNFHRIRCALAYGAHRLGEILMLPGEYMGRGLEKFFTNTLDRNGRGERPDVQIPVPVFGTGRSEASDLRGDYDGYYNGLLYSQWCHNRALSVPVPAQPSMVPSSQPPKKNSWDSLRRFVRCKRNTFYRRGTHVFFPTLPFSQPCALQLPTAAYGIDRITRSRGTGTYIPDMRHHFHREKQPRASVRNLESATPGLLQNSPKRTNPIEKSLKTDRIGNVIKNSLEIDRSGNPIENSMEADHSGKAVCHDLDLSPEQFPLLPSIKRTVTTNPSCSQPTMKSPLGETCPQSLRRIKFGDYECSSPIGMHSPPLGKQKQQALREFSEERVVVEPFQLNDKDFPPLFSM